MLHFQRGQLIKTLVLTLVVSTMLVECTPTPTPTPTSSDTTFTYQVEVQDKDTRDPIEGAEVKIAIGGDIAPVIGVTDRDGIVMIEIGASYVGKVRELTVTASGYDKYIKFVNLKKAATPEKVQLEKSGAPPTPTPTPTCTLTPSPTSTPTRTPTPSSTPASPPTAAPTATPTASSIDDRTSATPTSTSTRTPVSTPRPTSPPQATAPTLISPSSGGTYKSPITFQWRGSLNVGQAYQVTAYHVESGHVIQSGSLTAQTWTADLPGDKYGEWRWRVAVLANGEVAATSAEWMFWFQPFGGGGDDNGDGSTPTYTPPP